jgi:hypothetical protein
MLPTGAQPADFGLPRRNVEVGSSQVPTYVGHVQPIPKISNTIP